MQQMQTTGAALESLRFTPPSSASESPALAVKEVQPPSFSDLFGQQGLDFSNLSHL